MINTKDMDNFKANVSTDTRRLLLVFTHSPSPPVENEEIGRWDKNKNVEDGKSENKKDEDFEEDEDEETSKLERRASIHYVSRPVRLRTGEKLVAEVSSSSSPSVLSSPMSGILYQFYLSSFLSIQCHPPLPYNDEPCMVRRRGKGKDRLASPGLQLS